LAQIVTSLIVVFSARPLGSGDCLAYPLSHRAQPLSDGFLVLKGVPSAWPPLAFSAITNDALLGFPYTISMDIDEHRAHDLNVLLVTT
jgi:hypothetical protein